MRIRGTIRGTIRTPKALIFPQQATESEGLIGKCLYILLDCLFLNPAAVFEVGIIRELVWVFVCEEMCVCVCEPQKLCEGWGVVLYKTV